MARTICNDSLFSFLNEIISNNTDLCNIYRVTEANGGDLAFTFTSKIMEAGA